MIPEKVGLVTLTVLLFLFGESNASSPACGEKYPFISADWFGDALGTNRLGACSGRGICNNVTGLCTCDAGWTGLSDLVNTEGIDCQINDAAIRAEWGLMVFLCILVIIRTADNVRDRIRQHFVVKQRRIAQGKTYTIWRNNRTMLAMFLVSFGCFPSIILLGILRIAKTDERAGVTVGYTLFFVSGKVTFYIAALIFQPALLSSLLNGGNGDKKTINRMIFLAYTTQWCTFALSIIASIAPVIIILDEEKGVTELAQIIYIIYLALQIASMIILFVVSFIIRTRADDIFTKSYSLTGDERTRKLKGKVHSLETKAILSSFIIGLIYFSYLIFPALWNKHDYVFPLTWIPFVVLGREINNQHIKESGTTTQKEGSQGPISEDDSKSKERSFRTLAGTMFNRGKKGENVSNYVVPEKETSVQKFVSKSHDEDDGFV